MSLRDRRLRVIPRRSTKHRSEFRFRNGAWFIVFLGTNPEVYCEKSCSRLGDFSKLPKYAQAIYEQGLAHEAERQRRAEANFELHAQRRREAARLKTERREAHYASIAANREKQRAQQIADAQVATREAKRTHRVQRLLSDIEEKKQHMAILGPKRSRKLSVARRRALLETGGRCVYCNGAPGYGELTVEHLLPRSLGGSNAYENLTAACRTCNNRRGNKDEFLHLVCERWRPFVLWKVGGCVGPEFTRDGSKFHIPQISE